MHTGIIEMDSERGKQLGFTSDRFNSFYLWEDERRITISFVRSIRKGSFKALVDAILAEGKEVAIPTPLRNMERIVRQNGYECVVEEDREMGPVEVWILRPETD